MKTIFVLIALSLLSAVSQASFAQTQTQTCAAPDADADGDGWGWENNQSCQMPVSTDQVSAGTCVDSDGDGWGWDGVTSCIAQPDGDELFTGADTECVDSDGDGWGWDGVASCIAQTDGGGLVTGADAECVDSDGDGWGWDGVASCIAQPNGDEPASGVDTECVDSDGDGWGWDGNDSCLSGQPVDDVVAPNYTTVLINELLASNSTGLQDDDSDYSDWIELYNYGSEDLSLSGWCLTDDETDPAQWCFPASNDNVLKAGKYLVVFASGKDRVADNTYHTNFKLGKSGEYLGLYAAGGVVAISEYNPFPALTADQSYGFDASNQTTYFDTPTPAARNATASFGSLSFLPTALRTNNASNIVTLQTDNGETVSYTLTVSSDATAWLSANSASGEGAIELSIDTSSLIPGSYNGVLTASATGYDDVTLPVSTVVSFQAPGSGWESADVRLNDLPFGIDENQNRLFYSLGAGYSSPRNLSLKLTYNDSAGYGVGFNNAGITASGATVDLGPVSYATNTINMQLYKYGVKTADYLLIMSNLPIVSIKAESIVDEPDSPAIFQFVSGMDNVATDFVNMGIEYRGNTAQLFNKKPYGIDFKDQPNLEAASNLDISFPGMRSDDDWILDASYRDTSFVRNIASMDIWNDMRGSAYTDAQGSPQGQASIKGSLVEVIQNNQYQGIHVLQEQVDRKLLGLIKGSDSVLYKAQNNDATLYFPNSVRQDFEQKYPDIDEIEKWEPLEDLISFITNSSDQEFVSEIGNMVNIDNIVDYWLLTVATGSIDTLKKNYYIYRNQNEQFHLTPWDFDAAFGMWWTGRANVSFEAFWEIDKNQLISRLSKITATGFNRKLKARWSELNTSLLSVDSLASRFEVYYNQLVPIPGNMINAEQRNIARWPGSGNEGSATLEIGKPDWIRDWMTENWQKIDMEINNLSGGS